MAYDKSELRLLTDRLVADGMNHWTYDTEDSVATVIAADYISDAEEIGVEVGDKVTVRVWDDLDDKSSGLVSITEHEVLSVDEDGAQLSVGGGYLEIADAATLTLTEAQGGGTVILDKTDGAVIMLPEPKVGMEFHFKADATVASNAYKVITDAATTFIKGGLSGFAGNGTTHVAISMNGSTTGGIVGTWFTLRCISATVWEVVRGLNVTSGTAATPFATS